MGIKKQMLNGYFYYKPLAESVIVKYECPKCGHVNEDTFGIPEPEQPKKEKVVRKNRSAGREQMLLTLTFLALVAFVRHRSPAR